MVQQLTVYELVFSYILLFAPYILIGSASIVVIWLIKTKSFSSKKYLTANFIDESKEIVKVKVFDKNLEQLGEKIFFNHLKAKYEVINKAIFYDNHKPNALYKVGNPRPLDIATFKIPDKYSATEIEGISNTKVWQDLLSSIFSRKEMIILFLICINIGATAINIYFTYNNVNTIEQLIRLIIERLPVIPVNPSGPRIEIPVNP